MMSPGGVQGLFALLQHGVCATVMDVIEGEHGDRAMAVLGNFSDGDGGEAVSRFGNRIVRGGDARFRPRSHHLRDDVGIEEPGQPLGRALSSSANETGL